MGAVSQVSICNRALQRLGEGRIQALDENSPKARACNAAYDPTRRALLRKYAWNFAKGRASVAADSTKTVYGNLNRFEIPNDFIRLIRPPKVRVDWTIEGRFIVTSDGSPLQFPYVVDVTTPEDFDPLFAEVLSCDVAYEICFQVTGSNSRKQSIQVDRKNLLLEARMANAFELDGQEPLEDDFILAMK